MSIGALTAFGLGACSDDSGPGRVDATPDGRVDAFVDASVDAAVGDGGGDAGEPVLSDYLMEICAGRSPDDTAEATELTHAGTEPLGVIQGLQDGDIEAIGFAPKHPFRFDLVRVYVSGTGSIEIHVWDDWFRSEPDLEHDLTPAETKTITADGWQEMSFSTILRDPSQRFWVGIVHVSGDVHLALADGPGGLSRFKSPSLINAPFVWSGISGQVEYMVQSSGEYFCKATRTFFSDRTAGSGLDQVQAGRIAMSDLDGDQDDDVVFHLTAGSPEPIIEENEGNLKFAYVTDTTDVTDTHSNFAVLGDLDNDGDQDMYLGVYRPQDATDFAYYSSVWLNDGDGTFHEVVGSGVDLNGTTAAGAFADYDGDGYLDLYVGNWLVHYPDPAAMPDFLFQGQGDGTFVEKSQEAGTARQNPSPSYGVTWCDVDDDGFADILVANYGYASNFLFLNQGDGTFVEAGLLTHVAKDDNGGYGGNTFGIDCGDYDNDGHLDLFLAEIAHPRYQPWSDPSRLLHWTASANAYGFEYSDDTLAAGLPRDEGMIDPSWVDFDNDGDLDLFVSILYTGHASRLFRNNGDGTFQDVTYLAGIDIPDGQAGVWSDLDGDGDMDLIATSRRGGGTVYLYENTIGAQSRWMELDLVGVPPSNRDAIGARVTAEAGSLVQIHEVKGGKGHNNTVSTRVVHFGFGDVTDAVTVTVHWPSGRTERFTGLPDNARSTLTEGTGTEVP
ncbi:MAG: CRTAC1 family protein [Deltaproteobacteria bacterium]|nr:CRTAC1 family protein [Deltaproteobacteria bacterium]